MANLGKTFSNIFGFDPTPGYNLAGSGSGVYAARTKTKTPINKDGLTAAEVARQKQQDDYWRAKNASIGTKRTDGGGNDNDVVDGGQNWWTGGGGGVSAPAYDQNEVAKYDQGIAQINQAKGRLGNQLNIARGNINDQYSVKNNQLQSAFNSARNSYDGSTLQNSQALRTNNNNINDTHSAGARGLARLLGSRGAVGSDMGMMMDTVSDVSAADRSGANQTYAENQQGLDTNWNNFTTENDREKRELGDWRTRQLRSAEAQSKQTEAELESQLAKLLGEKSQYMGGSFASGAQGALDRANRLYGQVDALGRIRPTYDGKTPVYQQRDLDSYIGNTDATFQTQALPGAENTYLARLLGEDDRDKDRVLF